MKQKSLLTMTLLGGALAGAFLGLGATRLTPPVKAAPVATAAAPVAAPAAVTIGDLFSGKKYPLTLKAEQIDSSFYLTRLVDAQGNLSLYTTRGETVTAGGETFLVCYDRPVTDGKTQPSQPVPGSPGQLIFINMHALEALGGIVPVTTTADTSAPAAAPAPPAAP